MPAKIRKLIVQVDETRIEMGRAVEPPTRAALAMAVIDNPCAGRYVENLDELIAIGEELGGLLGAALRAGAGHRARARRRATARPPSSARRASWSTPPRSCIPSWARRCAWRSRRAPRWCRRPRSAAASARAIDVPLGHKDAAFVRSHFDAMEARVSDAPRANEIVVAVVVTDSGRPLPRIGGLQVHEIKGQDGLR